jgi:hypothetical protein
MPFTVACKDAGIKRHEFDAYVRLLGKRGIDWTEIQRVPEPGTQNRWLYVWEDRQEADAFCKEIQSETRDTNWEVRVLDPSIPASRGPIMPVVINVTRQALGITAALHPHSRTAIRRRFPNARRVSSVYVEYETEAEFKHAHGPMWDEIALVLTGLTADQLQELGGYRVFDPVAEKTVYESMPVTVS